MTKKKGANRQTPLDTKRDRSELPPSTESDQETPRGQTQPHIDGTLDKFSTKHPRRELRVRQVPTYFVGRPVPRLLDVGHILHEQTRFGTSYTEICVLAIPVVQILLDETPRLVLYQ